MRASVSSSSGLARNLRWLRRSREEAIARFQERGFPTSREEDWRFTNVAPLARTAFRRSAPGEAAGVRAAGRSVMTFTGFTLDELSAAGEAGREDVAALLASTDLLVAGPFLADQIDTRRPWVGSRNQEFVALTDRYAALLDNLDQVHDRVEVNVDASGRLSVSGWADLDTLDALLTGVEARPVR